MTGQNFFKKEEYGERERYCGKQSSKRLKGLVLLTPKENGVKSVEAVVIIERI